MRAWLLCWFIFSNGAVNANHPLAGETLHFDVTVVEIRDATLEELTHGPGGDH